ncbi:MAG: hypothetical protein LBU42_09085 [Prevotellaceae bacterium]|nr:hypothetical protein [Prevotellaceae bacterium]
MHNRRQAERSLRQKPLHCLSRGAGMVQSGRPVLRAKGSAILPHFFELRTKN